MRRAFIDIGSNISPAENVKKTVCLLAQQVRIVAISTVSCTETEGRPEQPPYYHCVGEIEKDTPP